MLMKKLLLISMLAILPIIVSAYDFMVNGVAYKVLSLDNLEVEVTDGFVADNDGKLVIPATVEYKNRVFKVLGIGDISIGATPLNSITDLTIEEGPTYIGSYAFWCQRIETIRIPKSITSIKSAAFLDNKGYHMEITGTWVSEPPINLIIEDGEEILSYNVENPFADGPFKNCEATYVYVGRNVNADLFKTALRSVETLEIGDQVKEITPEAIPNKYSKLYRLKTLIIGKGLKLVPYWEEGDQVEKIYVRTMTPQNSLGFDSGTFITATLYVPRGSKDAYMNADVWKNFWTIEEYDLENPGEGPNTNDDDVNEFYVNALGYRVLSKEDMTCEVFDGNYGGEVHVPGEVTYGNKTYKVLGIGEKALWGSNITALSMDNSLTYIGNQACAICSNLRKVTIPPSVINLGEGAFSGCSELETFIIEDGDEMLEHKLNNYYITTIDYDALKTVYIGRNFSKDIFYGRCCNNITDLTIGDKVTTFELDYFPSLLKLTIGKGLTSLPYMDTGDNLSQIIVNATTPISSGGFSNRTYLHTTLYVPQGCLDVYSTTEPWSNFLSIQEYDPTSLKSITAEKDVIDAVYLLNGRQVARLQKGINIIKLRDGRTRKINVK